MDIILYGSLHGSARRYAERLSEMTGIGAVSFDAVKNIADYDRVIYIGAIYAGCIRGLKRTVSHMSDIQQLFVASVGVADRPMKRMSGILGRSSGGLYLLLFTTIPGSSICAEPSTTAV